MRRVSIAITATLFLSACATTQLTSGADYNARAWATASDATFEGSSVIDDEIAEIAAVEPNLVFPARIGIAYIHRGSLAAVPADHLEAWAPLLDRIQPANSQSYGDVVPISPLIAQMVSKPAERGNRADIVNNIRRGAARQHVDYTLIYEVAPTQTEKSRNAFSVADLSVIGLFILPSRKQEVEATASAVFLDVRNGYPYGTASGVATKDGVSTASGTYDKREKLKNRAEIAAVEALALDAEVMFDQLIAKTVTDMRTTALTVSP